MSQNTNRQVAGTIEMPLIVDPMPITDGEEVNVVYTGSLAQEADRMFIHTGFGNCDDWEDIQDYEMTKTGRGWEASFKAKDGSQLNFCFTDGQGRWDNNKGRNWSCRIHNGRY